MAAVCSVMELEHHNHVQERNVTHQQPCPRSNHTLNHRAGVQTLYTYYVHIVYAMHTPQPQHTLREDTMSPSRLFAISTSLYLPEATCPKPSFSNPNEAKTSSLRHSALEPLRCKMA